MCLLCLSPRNSYLLYLNLAFLLQVEELKTKVEELEVNMGILREEMESGGGGEGNGEGNSVQMKQIMSQNERLREALIKLD